MKSQKSVDIPTGVPSALSRWTLRLTHAVERHAAALRDAADDALRAREQPRAVAAGPEVRRHVLAARFAGEAVRDPLFEVVADFDFDPALA